MSIHRVLIDLIAKDRASGEFRKVSNEANNMARGLGSLQGALQLAGIGGFAYLGKQALDAVVDLGQLGAQSLRLEASFQELARQAGGSSDAILSAVKRATDGTVAEMDIIQSVNRGILLGLGAQADQWEELAEVARFRARAMGISMTQALGDITTAIGRESRMIADNLGIIWDMDSIMSNYAATLGKTADQLTQAERKQALLQETIRIGQDQIAEAGGLVSDQADSMEALNAKIADLKTAFGEELVPAVSAAADSLIRFLDVMEDIGAGPVSAVNELSTMFSQMAGSVALYSEAIKQGFVGLDWDLGKADMEASRIAAEQGADAMWDYIEAVTSGKDPYWDLVDAHERWRLGLEGSMSAHEAFRLGLRDTPSAASVAGSALDGLTTKVHSLVSAYMSLSSETKKWVGERTKADIMGRDPYEDRVAAEQALIDMQEDNARKAEEHARRYADAWTGAVDDVGRSYDQLRGIVESALQPTSVTALDMEQTALGTYADKWDEDARRLDAIAQRGFAELQEHADWAGILQIPPEILGGSEAALKEWAQRTSAQVRNLMRPDLLADNVEEMADVVEQFIRDQEAREVTIDLVIGELQSRGFTEATARKQVEQLMGGEGAMALGLPEEDLEGVALQGDEVAKKLLAGYKEAISETTPIADFARHVIADIGKQHDVLSNAGRQAWRPIWESMREAIQTTPILSEIALAVSPYVARILQQQGIF